MMKSLIKWIRKQIENERKAREAVKLIEHELQMTEFHARNEVEARKARLNDTLRRAKAMPKLERVDE
jgi:hypothetical protein